MCLRNDLGKPSHQNHRCRRMFTLTACTKSAHLLLSAQAVILTAAYRKGCPPGRKNVQHWPSEKWITVIRTSYNANPSYITLWIRHAVNAVIHKPWIPPHVPHPTSPWAGPRTWAPNRVGRLCADIWSLWITALIECRLHNVMKQINNIISMHIIPSTLQWKRAQLCKVS